MTNIYASLPRYTGETLTMYLYDAETGTAVNSGGDSMVEVINGAFYADITVSIDSTVRVDVKDDSSNLLGSDLLYYGETVVGKLPATVTSGTSLPSGTYYNVVNRDDTDVDDLFFEWGSDDTATTITCEVSIDGAAYATASGTVSYVREEAGAYLWKIGYDSNDRPNNAANLEFKLTDGTNTRIIPVIINSGGSTAQSVLGANTLLTTTISSVVDTKNYVLTDGSPDDSAYKNQLAIFIDQVTSEQVGVADITAWDAGSKTLTIEEDVVFSPAAGDTLNIIAVVDVSDISTAVSSILSVANVPVGDESGFPDEILVGDAYTIANGREIKMYFYDDAGNVITDFGDKSPSDADFTWYWRATPQALVDGVIVNAQVEIAGDENDWNTDDPAAPYLVVELPSDELDGLTVASGRFTQNYTWQLILQWGADDTYELTPVTNGEVTVRRKIEEEV